MTSDQFPAPSWDWTDVNNWLTLFQSGNREQLALSELAAEYRIPRSELDSWPGEDIAAAVGLMLYRREQAVKTCGACGTNSDEWEGGRGFRPRIEASLHSCRGCQARAAAEKEIPSDDQPWTTVRFTPVLTDDERATQDELWGEEPT